MSAQAKSGNSLAVKVLRERRKLWLEERTLSPVGMEFRPWVRRTLDVLEMLPRSIFTSCVGSSHQTPSNCTESFVASIHVDQDSRDRLEIVASLFKQGQISDNTLQVLIERESFFSKRRTVGLEGLNSSKRCSIEDYRLAKTPIVSRNIIEEESVGWALEDCMDELKLSPKFTSKKVFLGSSTPVRSSNHRGRNLHISPSEQHPPLPSCKLSNTGFKHDPDKLLHADGNTHMTQRTRNRKDQANRKQLVFIDPKKPELLEQQLGFTGVVSEDQDQFQNIESKAVNTDEDEDEEEQGSSEDAGELCAMYA
jgi:hypothetical protein